MKSASRTLVKSQPELWELIDQPDRMQGLMSALLGRAADVTVNEREPESLLSWEAAGDSVEAWIKVELAEKGWGTHVEVTAENATEPVRLEGWLDAVLEELATPQKRPFEGMTEASESEAPPAKPEPVEEAPVEEPPVEERSGEEPQATEPQVEEPQPAPTPGPEPAPKKKKRLFGLL